MRASRFAACFVVLAVGGAGCTSAAPGQTAPSQLAADDASAVAVMGSPCPTFGPSVSEPVPRGDAAIAADPVSGRVLLLTGTAPSGSVQAWLFRDNDWHQMPAALPSFVAPPLLTYDAALGEPLVVDDAQAWTFDGHTWRGTIAPPKGVTMVAMTYDPALKDV